MWNVDARARDFASILLAAVISGCGSGAVVSEGWQLQQLLTQAESTSTLSETAESSSCPVPERKTVTCSAGTANDLVVSLGGTAALNTLVGGSIAYGVSTGLGLGKERGESLALEEAPVGYVYVYTLEREMRVVRGEVLTVSSSGRSQKAPYTFNASCSLRIVSRQLINCEDAEKKRSQELPLVTVPAPNASTRTGPMVDLEGSWDLLQTPTWLDVGVMHPSAKINFHQNGTFDLTIGTDIELSPIGPKVDVGPTVGNGWYDYPDENTVQMHYEAKPGRAAFSEVCKIRPAPDGVILACGGGGDLPLRRDR